ncbi:MAG: glycosyltransferase [Chloroflexota bacterium]|nr:glycosyltransferase [Chloroflexota bacterium]
MLINILTPGFTTSNGSAFLFPLVVHKKILRDAQFDIRFVTRSTIGLTECDVLMIDSKEFRKDWDGKRRSQTLELISSYGDSNSRVIWCDTTDSTGTIQSSVIPFVEKYLKSQLLKNKIRYTNQMYGDRIFSHYYNKTAGIEDWIKSDINTEQNPLISTADTAKLVTSWNSGLADYSTYGPWKIGLYRRLGLSLFLRYPKPITRPIRDRPNDLSARFGITYSRASIRYQREQIRKLLSNRLDTNKLTRRSYMKELSQTKIILSPFGWGEITLKDFEVFLTGGMLLKPSMKHMETWPNFYTDGVTYRSHDWDLDDLQEKIDWALDNNKELQTIAAEGQERYLRYTSGTNAAEMFVKHFTNILST